MKSLLPLLAFAIVLTFTGCDKGSNPEPSIEDQQLAKLTATWRVATVSLDGSDKTADYKTPSVAADFQLQLSGTAGADSFNYTVSNRPLTSPWPSSGTWTFLETNPEQTILRYAANETNPLTVNYTVSADGNTLQLSFTFSGSGYQNARTANVSGNWVFTFTKA